MFHEWFLYIEGITGQVLVWLERTPCIADIVTGLRMVLGWVD